MVYSSMTVTEKTNESLGMFILRQADKYSSRPALWCNNQIVDYNQLSEHAKSLAATFCAFDQNKSNVAIYCYRSASAYISMFATLLAGKAYVPLNPRFPTERNRTIADLAGTNIFCIDKRCEKQASEWVAQTNKRLLILFPEHETLPQWCAQHPRHNFLCAQDFISADDWIAPSNLTVKDSAYLLFTSGTTGEPKGIAASHGNVLAYLSHLRHTWPLSPTDKCSQIYDQTFDVSVHDIFTCWQSGACLYIVPEAALLCPVNFVNTHQLTCWGSVPSLLGFIKRFGKLTSGVMPTIKYSFFCGEALPTDATLAWADACPNSKIINLFGPTEATIAITAYEFQRQSPPDTAVMPIGLPFENQETVIIDNAGVPVAMGDKGHLLLGGSQVVKGYLNNPGKTAEQFIEQQFAGKRINRWYQTGDIASEHIKYGLLFHGRKDFQVKINGYRVELDEISGILREKVHCTWIVTIPWPVDKVTGVATGIVVWISGDKERNIDEIELKRFCMSKLPPYMVPSRIFWADTLPENYNGKVDIKSLQRMTQEIMG